MKNATKVTVWRMGTMIYAKVNRQFTAKKRTPHRLATTGEWVKKTFRNRGTLL